MLEKLGLGTVQFGQAYGISSTHGQVSKSEASAILDRAAKAGVALLDTAANYGEAESVLATLDTRRFRVVTKCEVPGLANSGRALTLSSFCAGPRAIQP